MPTEPTPPDCPACGSSKVIATATVKGDPVINIYRCQICFGQFTVAVDSTGRVRHDPAGV
jgi:hypothetical protein